MVYQGEGLLEVLQRLATRLDEEASRFKRLSQQAGDTDQKIRFLESSFVLSERSQSLRRAIAEMRAEQNQPTYDGEQAA